VLGFCGILKPRKKAKNVKIQEEIACIPGNAGTVKIIETYSQK